MISAAIVCSCGGPIEIERVTLPDGRRRLTLRCLACWDSMVEHTRRQLVEAHIGGRLVPLGYIDVPA